MLGMVIVILVQVFFFFDFAVLQSKRFVQIVMTEDIEASLFVLMFLENIFKTNRLGKNCEPFLLVL